MLALLIAATLLQSAPDAATAAPKTAEGPAAGQGPRDSGLPKDDYGLVAWCHGAVAGQLELDPIVKADMEKIEGKAKVQARAASDAEMEKERRSFLKDYEHALAAAEAASPSYIHETGVQAEQRGYGLWTPTRNKAPIWRMLDWGMWDPNDVGCNEAAKRLYNRSKLFGEALKGADEPEPAPAATVAKEDAAPAAAVAADARVDTPTPAPTPVPTPAETGEPVAEAADQPAAPAAAPPRKPARLATRKPAAKKLSMSSSAEDIRDAIARGKAELAASPPAPSAEATPAQPTAEPAPAPALRGPQ